MSSEGSSAPVWAGFAPLRATDADPFTRDSVFARLPAIVEETVKSNDSAPAAWKEGMAALAADIRGNGAITALESDPDPGWESSYTAPYIGQSWGSVPWFFLENYAYRRVLALCRAHAGAPADPFIGQKRHALLTAIEPFCETVVPVAVAVASSSSAAGSPVPDASAALDRLHDVILRSLWGNRADLSLTGGKPHVHTPSGSSTNSSSGTTTAATAAAPEPAVLCDDWTSIQHALTPLPLPLQTGQTSTTPVVDGTAAGGGSATVDAAATGTTATTTGGRVVTIILDNCGLELLTDLVLAAALLRGRHATAVHLHCKADPVFVSDALAGDITEHIDALADVGVGARATSSFGGALPAVPEGCRSACAALAADLRAWLAGGTLRIVPHAFYTSPLPWWDAPDDLRGDLAHAALAIVKGDANYRRLLGDRHWPHAFPFADATRYFPCPLLALRTCKAGILCGVGPGAVGAAVSAHGGRWLTNGMCGVVQAKL